MKTGAVALFALILLAPLAALGHLGDSAAQTVIRYGEPVAVSAAHGETSTRTFSKDGLEIICGYVGDRVEMIRYSRADRPYVSTEIDAILHTNVVPSQPWNPDKGAPGTYRRPDGAIAKVMETSVDISTVKWRDALAKDKATAETRAKDEAMAKAAAADSATNAATGEDSSATNSALEESTVTVTNVAP